MLMLVNCSNCRTPLQLPPNAQSIRCAICHSVTLIADPRGVLPPDQSSSSNGAGFPPPPSPQHYSPVPPSAHGRKKAVICGISYRFSRHELKGCINDAKCMKYMLVNRFKFPESSIIMLNGFFLNPRFQYEEGFLYSDSIRSGVTKVIERLAPNVTFAIEATREIAQFRGKIGRFGDLTAQTAIGIMNPEEETDPYKIPTKQNLRMALYWLVQGCQPGDSLVFHYSGHGSRQRNFNGDEVDGFDETLCPLDFEMQGMIVDDEINATIVRPLPRGAKLHAIIDACHSGTVLDLPFLCRMNRSGQYVWEDHRPRSGVWKGTNGGEAISFSGCDDDQTSADTSALSRITSTGAMTFCFIQAIERGAGTTYGSMLTYMRNAIRGTGDTMGGGPVTSLITMLLTGGSLGGGLKQEPQLTSYEPFDVYAKPFSL